ncbi:MAG: hypothetical protein K2M06_05660 [Muribaculaceae bacterium]|nr:hypothetical protein [Muribaculaceae bacterium]
MIPAVRNAVKAILAPVGAGIALSMLCASCFTGVESTPRIDDSALKKAKAVAPSPEEIFLNSVVPPSASQWLPGKKLLVSDPKIRLVFTTGESGEMPSLRPGEEITFRGFESARSLLGEDVADAVFSSETYPLLKYRLPFSHESLARNESPAPEIPFTVDPVLATKADSLIRSRKERLYILTPLWYDAATEASVGGYRLVGVEIDSVRPGTHIFPIKVYFHVSDPVLAATLQGKGEKMVFMSHGGNGRANSRSFASLFSFHEPRKRYPQITDDVWELIINSKVREGMTKEECRLALGSPANIDMTPTRVGDVEKWSYSDGLYLIFNPDGTLMRYRL